MNVRRPCCMISGWRWRPSFLLTCLAMCSTLVQGQEDDNLSFNDLLSIDDDFPASIEEQTNIQKRMAGCIFEPEIIPEGSEQFGIRLKPLKSQSTSLLEPAASTYRAAQYQPVRYNLPPLMSSENNNVNNVDYPPYYNPLPKSTRNPYSISNYKATTPKYPLTTPETDDEAESAGSADDYAAVKPSTSAPEYLPPYQEPKTPRPKPKPVSFSQVPRQRLVQQQSQNVNFINPAPRQPLVQNYLPPEAAPSNVDTVKQPFQNSVYYTPTVPTRKPYVPQPTANYFYQTQKTTFKPIRVENLNYLPPESAAPSNENPSFVQPSTTTTTTTTTTAKPANEYLPPENPDSTNDNPSFLKPAQQKQPVDGLANRFTTPDEHYHTLEELCNDPFHSFLCVPLKPRSKDRFKNRNSKKVEAGSVPDSSFLQPQAVFPSETIPTTQQALVPAASFQDITKTKLPEDKHDCDKAQPIVPAPSINQFSIAQIPEASYLPPLSTTTTPAPTTTAVPKKPSTGGLYAKNPFSELVFQPIKQASQPQPFIAPIYLQPQINYVPVKPVLPQPSSNQFQFVPRQFPTTIKPLKLQDEPCDKDNNIVETPAASSVSENLSGYNYPKPSASSVVSSGYNYPQPAASSVVTTGYNYPQPSASSVVSTGYNYPQPSPSSVGTTGYSYPQPSPPSAVPTGYSYPQPNPAFNEVPQASNDQPATTGYQYPVPAFNQQYLAPAASINYLVPAVQPTESTTTTTPVPSTVSANLGAYPPVSQTNVAAFDSPKDDEFPPINPNHFTFLPGEFEEINKFEAGYPSGKPKPSAAPEKQQFLGYNLPTPAKNDTPLIPAADTSSGYYYPSPQPVIPAASTNVESFSGYSYPKPSDNQPVFETTPKTDDGYDYPVPPAERRLSLPSNIFPQKLKLPLEDKKALVKFEKEDCDKKQHFTQPTSGQERNSKYQRTLSSAGDSNVYVFKV